MAEPDRAPEGALHDEDDVDDGHVRAWRGRAGDSIPPGDTDPLSLTERNRQRIAKRWGQRIEEPAEELVLDSADEGFGWRDVLAGITVHVHLVRDGVPSMRAVNADYKAGLEDAQQQSATAAGLYRAFGRAGHACGLAFRFGATCCDRPGRFAASLLILVLLTGSVLWALFL